MLEALLGRVSAQGEAGCIPQKLRVAWGAGGQAVKQKSSRRIQVPPEEVFVFLDARAGPGVLGRGHNPKVSAAGL